MLLSIGRRRYRPESNSDVVHNYYEHVVFDQILRASDRARNDADFLSDVACVALNRLPPRYVRYDVDMTFFMTPEELDAMADRVAHAVNEAVSYVESREQRYESEDIQHPSNDDETGGATRAKPALDETVTAAPPPPEPTAPGQLNPSEKPLAPPASDAEKKNSD